VSEEFKDKELSCIECKGAFTWAADEQARFYEKGLKKREPKRCPSCRQEQDSRRNVFNLKGPKSR
jgi:NAD-dependent SIR2 family protein deacetylase